MTKFGDLASININLKMAGIAKKLSTGQSWSQLDMTTFGQEATKHSERNKSVQKVNGFARKDISDSDPVAEQ